MEVPEARVEALERVAVEDGAVLGEGLLVAPVDLEDAPQAEVNVEESWVLVEDPLHLAPVGGGIPLQVVGGGGQGAQVEVGGVGLERLPDRILSLNRQAFAAGRQLLVPA